MRHMKSLISRFALILPIALPLLLSCKGEVISPTATVESVTPQVVCAVQQVTPIVIRGNNFTPLPTETLTDNPVLELPKLFLSQRTKLDGTPGTASDVRIYDGADQNHVRFVGPTQLDFDVYPGMVLSDFDAGSGGVDLPTGLYDVIVQNPDQVRAPKESALAVVPPPMLTAVTPNPSCNEQAESSFTVTGSNFLRISGELPVVAFAPSDGSGVSSKLTTVSAQNCTALPSPAGVMIESCTELTVTAAKGSFPPASYRATVTNPGAASCVSQEDVRIVTIPAPVVTTVGTLAVCSIANTTLQITGQNFLQLAGPPILNPTIVISGKSFATTLDGCTPIPDASGAQLCTTVNFTIPANMLPPSGTVSLQAVITNPGGNACSTTMAINIDVVGPPTISAVAPKTICAGGGPVTITGTNLYSGGAAIINSTPAVTSRTYSAASNGTTATAVFAGPLPVGGPYNLTVRNQLGCEATLAGAISVSNGPSILFVDPPAIPNVTTIQATVYATSISPPVKAVSIAPTGTMNYTSLVVATSPAFPNRALITIPAGLPAGSYDMKLDDQTMCSAFLPNALKIVATATLTVTKMDPGFGSAAQDTAAIITGAGFVSTPRAYLSPTSGAGQAQAMAAVTFQSATSLSAVARAGLPAGQYDLIVVNPDGAYGIKKNAFTVTSATAPPPVVTSIAPSSFVTGTSTPTTISGSGFRTGATLTVSCQDAAGVAVVGGAGTVTAVTATSISANLTATGLLCVVRVTNQDGTFFDYSAIGVTNSSLNLSGFKNATNMTVARRALGAAAGRPTPVARFVYAIGGDTGADNKPLASVEAAPTAIDGTLGTWFTLPTAMPKPLSFQGIGIIGRFLYAVGGFDGAAAVRDVYRAEILNPLAAIQVSDADVRFNATVGLGPGIYTYRVATVMGAADANNPGGETLASDPFPIQLPTVAGKLQPVIYWNAVVGAQSYRIYRSPKANDPAGKELLVGTVPAATVPLRFTDDGTVTPAGAAPLPLGATGVWRPIASLATARAGAGVAVAQDPVDPTKWYVYAAGGNSGTIAAPTALSSIEFLPITVGANGTTQTFTTWTPSTFGLSRARWALSALPATAATNSIVTNKADTYLFVASGSTTSLTTLEGMVESAKVASGGQLTAAFVDARTAGTGIKRPAYGGTLVNNQMMAFGGFAAGAAATNSDSSSLSSPTQCGNFNALGSGVLKLPRALQGTAIESAFIYQLGGASAGPNTAQNTTEQTIW